MSIYANKAEQYLVNSGKLAEQQKDQRTIKIKNIVLKQTQGKKLAESFAPTNKKVTAVNDSTKNLEVFQKQDSENENQQEIVPVEIHSDNSEDEIRPNIRALPSFAKSGDLMRETLVSLMRSHNSLKIEQDDSGKATFLGVPLNTLGGDKMRINENEIEITPEIHKALSSKGYNGKSMKKDSDMLMMNVFMNGLGYTGFGDKSSERKIFLSTELPKKVAEIQSRILNKEKSDDLKGPKFENIIQT